MADGCLGIETLIDFVDGRADPAVRLMVEHHASQCDECREVLSSLARSGTPKDEPSRRTLRPVSVLAAGAQVGRYVIAREVGAGGMGAVYAAHDPELGRMVAVKVLRRWGDHRMQARLRREAQTMARLAHPNVVAVHDVGAFGDQIFIAMEYVEGETLAHWMAKPHPWRIVLEVFRAAGRGLAAAHAAGIVHRDFKPENVLIGNDGRVCVGDFGLARAAGSREIPPPSRPPPDPRSVVTEPADPEIDDPLLASDDASAQPGLTVPGTVVGTPYYMAPELYAGAPADERSDQFSFCLALLTAIHGERPADLDTVDSTARAIRFRALVHAQRLPRRIRAALYRGLAADPAARFGSLGALIDALAPQDRLPRWAIAAGAAVVLGLVAVSWYTRRPPAAIDQRCTGAAAAYAPTWSPERRAAIASAFTATRAPFAAATLAHVTDGLDHYAARWTDAHTQTCRATRILGDQTEATLELRMACLERRRQDAAALIGTLATADTAVVTRAIEAVAGLPDIAMCADIAALRQRIPPPRDPATRAKLAALAPRLAEAQAKLDTGSYAAGLALARPIADEGRALGYRPFEAEADYVQGKLEADLGDTEHAGPTLEAAVLAAEAGRNDEIAARARIALVVLIGQDESDYARATALAPYAAAAIIRIGGNADLEFDLEEALGAVAYTASKLDIAQVHFQNALDIEQRAHGMDHPSAAQALRGLGINAMTQGRTAQAVALFERSLAIYERTLGPDHPRVARELAALGNAHVDDGQIDLAVQCLRRALAIHEVVLGPNHPTVGNDASDLARALRAEHHDAEALVLDRRAVAIGERTQGPDHPIYAEELMGLAGTLEQLHQFTEAAEQLRRAEAIFTKVYGPHHDGVVRVHAALAELLFAEARWRDAMAAYDRVIPELEHAQDIGSWLPEARINQAMAALELHQPARALAAIEPLSSHLDAQQARLRGTIRFVMARALWDRGSDRARVRELLATGRAELAAAGPEAAAGLIDLDAWVARHPAARPPAR